MFVKERLARFDREVIKPLFLRSEGLSNTLRTPCHHLYHETKLYQTIYVTVYMLLIGVRTCFSNYLVNLFYNFLFKTWHTQRHQFTNVLALQSSDNVSFIIIIIVQKFPF